MLAVLVAVLGWQIWVYRNSRDTLAHPAKEIVGSMCPDGAPSMRRAGVGLWPRKQSCPSSLPWIKTSTAPLVPALCDWVMLRRSLEVRLSEGVTTRLHAHRQSIGQGLQRGLA